MPGVCRDPTKRPQLATRDDNFTMPLRRLAITENETDHCAAFRLGSMLAPIRAERLQSATQVPRAMVNGGSMFPLKGRDTTIDLPIDLPPEEGIGTRYFLKNWSALDRDARFFAIAASSRAISSLSSATRSRSSSIDSKARSCPISWASFFLGRSSSSLTAIQALQRSRFQSALSHVVVTWRKDD